jgi:toxin secretion/phage lysis holin
LYTRQKSEEDENMEKIKVIITAIVSMLMSWLGILAVPVLLLVGCNIIDYGTGLCAAKYRSDKKISSYKSIRGIAKKVCMYLLVIIGAFVDILIQYAVSAAGIELAVPFIVATIVAVWLVVNEIISILENMIDIGVNMPPFLLPILKYIKKQVEDSATIEGGKSE